MSALEDQLEVQLKTAGIRYERELRFFMGRRFKADFVVLPDEPHNPPQSAMALVDVHGTGPMGRHGSYGHLTNDSEKGCLAVALGWRYVTVTAEMVRDGRALGVVEALVRGRALPDTMLAPRRRRRSQRTTGRHKRSAITKTLDNKALTKLPARVRRAAGMA